MERTPVLLKMDIRSIPLSEVSTLTEQMPPLRREKILAIRDPQEPTPKIGNIADVILQEDDVLFIIGPNEALDKLKD